MDGGGTKYKHKMVHVIVSYHLSAEFPAESYLSKKWRKNKHRVEEETRKTKEQEETRMGEKMRPRLCVDGERVQQKEPTASPKHAAR